MSYIGARPQLKSSIAVNGSELGTGTTSYTGGPHTMTVSSPQRAGIIRLNETTRPVSGNASATVKLAGARGSDRYFTAGSGGRVQGTVSLEAGTYYFVAGTVGSNATGGYPGGGNGQEQGAAGGGFSGLWRGGSNNPLDSANRSNYILIGGGGGGRSSDTVTGGLSGGGYPTGQQGEFNNSSMTRPGGGTQSAGGSAGLNINGVNGGCTAGSGFTGGLSGSCGDGAGSGGAGGGGWYGGGGGPSHCGQGGASGGGGSSYYDSNRVTSFSHATGENYGAGYVEITL